MGWKNKSADEYFIIFVGRAKGMKRSGEPRTKSQKVVLVASDAVSGNGDEILPQTAVAKHIGLLPVLCSARTTEARVSNPSYLLSAFSGMQPQDVQGFGTDNAVVVPLMTDFHNPAREPRKKPQHFGSVATVLYADSLLEDTELFVAAKDVRTQVREEMAWLASIHRSGRIVSLPVLLPVTTKRFLCPADHANPARFDLMHRKTSAARTALNLSPDDSTDGGTTLFASRWARLVTLFAAETNEPAIVSRMCAMLGIPMDKSGLAMCVWPISTAAATSTSVPSVGTSVAAAYTSRLSLMSAPKWRMQHAHLPLWFFPVFLAAANDISGHEIHDVHQATMQIAGQLSILSSYASPSQRYAAMALDRLFATVQHIKTDTAMHLVNAAFSVGPILDSVVRDRERVAALEAAAEAALVEKRKSDERISALESQVVSLLEVTEALFNKQMASSTANK